MSVSLVVSQPMLMPWCGMFEQIRLCDHFVFYDDVQIPLGGGRGRGFITRVQVKTAKGIDWISIPVLRSGKGEQLIKEASFLNLDWKREHLGKIEQAYRASPYFNSIYSSIIEPIYQFETENLSEFCINSMTKIWGALGFSPRTYLSSELGISRELDASVRVLEICKLLEADYYISGLGAMNYIDYSIFDVADVQIKYMNYQLKPYPQMHGVFTPYVSVIDMLCNIGTVATAEQLTSGAVYWKDWPYMEEGRPVARPRE
jgi:hypothetical protein